MKLSIVLSTHAAQFEALAYKGDFADNVAHIASLGYDGVELAVRDPNLLDVAQVNKIIGWHGLRVPAIGTGQAYGEEGLSFTDPDKKVRARAIERIFDQIELASCFGAQVIVGLIRGRVQAGVERDQAMEWLVSALRQCAARAEKKGVKLTLEPVNRYETDLIVRADEGLALIEQVGSQALGLLLDTFHMNIEEPSIEESIAAAGKHISHFHVADSNRWYPGAGHVNFASVVDTLRSIGYEGYLSAEILPLPDVDTCARKTIEHLRPIVG
jgi:sugar phosphate isomerase/epimerase